MILAFLLVVHLYKSEMVGKIIEKQKKKVCVGKSFFMNGICQKQNNPHSKQFKQSQESVEKYNVASSWAFTAHHGR